MSKVIVSATLAAITALIVGCDVSNGGGGGGAQKPDPVVVDFPIAYIERPIPRDEDGVLVSDDVFDPTVFKPGAKLILKARASVPADEIVITDVAFMETPAEGEAPADDATAPLYDVKDLDVSSDGKKLIFAMRAPEIEDADEDEQPTWNIWEYDRDTQMLRRIINSDVIAETGQDISPTYLPDGRIIFSSTRQRRSKAILLDESKPQFAALTEDGSEEAFLLHIMNEDGSGIRQLTFNQSHDLHPTVLDSGEVLFLRWDNYGQDRLSLYKINPDGSNLTLMYGYHSPNTGTNNSEAAFLKPRQLPDGRVLVSLQPRDSSDFGGDMVAIDIDNFIDVNQGIASNAGSGPAQESLAVLPVNTEQLVVDDAVVNSPNSTHGYFNSAFPLFDESERLLVSWSSCLVQAIGLNIYVDANMQLIGDSGQFVNRDGDNVTDPVTVPESEVSAFPCTDAAIALDSTVKPDPLYGIWIYDRIEETQAPVVIAEQGMMYTEAIVIEPKTAPTFIPDPQPGVDIRQDLVDENAGILHIRSVYDMDGVDISAAGISAMRDPAVTPVDTRPARFIRILKAVSLPDDDLFDLDIGMANGIPNRQLKDIIGYAPIHPDGSAMFKVPADIAFTISILDGNGRRLTSELGVEHQNWLTLKAGEVRQCNGCHSANSELPHGRSDAEAPSVNPGGMGGINFPNTLLSATVPPEEGESMAQYYARVSLTDDPSSIAPSVNLVFEDVWTDDTIAGLEKAPSFEYAYTGPVEGEDYTAPVAIAGCIDTWNGLCRIVVSYPDHIQPIWDRSRSIVRDTETIDVTCTNCHSTVNADGMTIIPEPSGAGGSQLDLSSLSTSEDNFLISYEDLFRASAAEELRNGILNAEQEDEFDGNNNAVYILGDEPLDPDDAQLIIGGILYFQATSISGEIVAARADTTYELLRDEEDALIPALGCQKVEGLNECVQSRINTGRNIPAFLNGNGANSASNQAFLEFLQRVPEGVAPTGHQNYLSDAELKLISEWLDIGGQYYNNPFDTLN